MNRGFTVVELLITMAVMAILLGLGVVSFRSALANARDNQRESDISVLTRAIELRYKSGLGNSTLFANGLRGSYPDNAEIKWGMAETQSSSDLSDTTISCTSKYTPCPSDTNPGHRTKWLLGTSEAVFFAPENSGNSLSGARLVSPSSSSRTSTKAALLSQGYYYYESFNESGSPCTIQSATDVCTKFTLTYRRESDGSLIVINSRHR